MISCVSVKPPVSMSTYGDNATGVYKTKNGDWCADPAVWFEMYKQRMECEAELDRLRNDTQ